MSEMNSCHAQSGRSEYTVATFAAKELALGNFDTRGGRFPPGHSLRDNSFTARAAPYAHCTHESRIFHYLRRRLRCRAIDWRGWSRPGRAFSCGYAFRMEFTDFPHGCGTDDHVARRGRLLRLGT